MVQAQEYLDQNYPQKERTNITDLSISHQELVGKLDLSEFVNLEYLDCSDNQLTSLNISNHKQLKYLNCNDNKLTNLDLSNLGQLEVLSCSSNYLISLDYSAFNPEQLTYLNISDNNLSVQDLSVLSHLVNLKHLHIGNTDQDKIDQDIYNRWTGSLESLQGLSKLRSLDISNTDISAGVEYLPFSLKKIYCSTKERPTSKVQAIIEQLKNSSSFRYDEKQDAYVSTKQELTYPAQAWLDQHYPVSERKNIRYLDLAYENLTGSLQLVGFSNLRDFDCFSNNLTELEIDASGSQLESIHCNNNQLTKLDLSHCSQLKGLNCHNNQLTKLDCNTFSQLRELYCWQNNLSSLDLANCNKLEILYCWENQLTELNLTTNSQLTELGCQQNQLTQLLLPKQSNLKKLVVWGNYLTDLDWSVLASDKLIALGLQNNNFSTSDLSVFSRFKQLEKLYLGNYDQEKINHNICNGFSGSLRPLRHLTKLKVLDIFNTKIDSGLEYLPRSLMQIWCHDIPLKEQVKKTKEWHLSNRDLNKWRQTNFDLVLQAKDETIKELIQQLTVNKQRLSEVQQEKELLDRHYHNANELLTKIEQETEQKFDSLSDKMNEIFQNSIDDINNNNEEWEQLIAETRIRIQNNQKQQEQIIQNTFK